VRHTPAYRSIYCFLFLWVFSGIGIAPVKAATTYNGTNGVVSCGTSGNFTIANNVVTSASACKGNVSIPAGVTGVGAYAFAYTSNQITSASIPNTVTSIGAFSFSYQKLTGLGIPNSVTNVGEGAFFSNQLTNVFVPSSVIEIGKWAFANNPQLLQIEVSAENTFFRSTNGALLNKSGTVLLAHPSAQGSTYVFPAGVTSIGPGAFTSAQLTYVAIPSRITSIGDDAFSGNQLESVWIPNTVTSIGKSVFMGNNLASVTIPDSVTTIGVEAFNSNKIKSVTIPNSVTSIGNQAFSSNMLSSVTIPSNVTSIGDSAFGNNRLTSVTIPSSVTSIGGYAFSWNGIRSVRFLGNAPSDGGNIFFQNSPSSFPSVVVDPSSTGWGSTFSGKPVLKTYDGTNGVVYCDSSGIFIITSNEVSGSSFCVGGASIPDRVTSIQSNAFARNVNYYNQLTSVTIPSSVTSIGSSAFYGNDLASVTIPSSVTSIGSSAFYGNQLTSVAIPNSVTSIDPQAFYGNKLTSVTLPSSVTTIGSGAFGSNKIASVTIPSSVTSIGDSAFSSNMLSSVTIPSSVTDIGGLAFWNNQLTSARFLGSAPLVSSENSFEGNPDLAFISVTKDATGWGEMFSGKTVRRDYIVAFNSHGGTAISDVLITAGSSITKPTQPILAGHTFLGWSATSGGAVIEFPYNPEVTSSVMLYAKWVKNPVKAVATVKPTISGMAKVSKTLTAKKGTWTGYPTPTVSYQWYACIGSISAPRSAVPTSCKKITGATKSTFKLTSAQKGKWVTVLVTGTSSGTTKTSWLAKSTGKVS
jgi:hypothetical protein